MWLQASITANLLALTACFVHYIAPLDSNISSSSITCLFEGQLLNPCVTFQMLANKLISRNSFDDGNITLSFLPGVHKVNNSLLINFKDLNEIKFSPLKSDVSEIRIECSAEMSLNFIDNISMISVEFLEFYGCGGKTRELNVIHLTGTHGELKIVNSSFVEIQFGRAVFIQNNLSILNISGCTFMYNNGYKLSALFGGVVNLHITGSNIVIIISISNSNFAHNIGKGINIYTVRSSTESTAKIESCVFLNNTSNRGSGITLFKIGFEIVIMKCLFHSNSADLYGGAFSLYTSSNRTRVTIVSCNFTENTGFTGGALYVFTPSSSSTYIVIIDGLFHNNSAKNGGAINIPKNACLQLSASSFRSNRAAISGGAIYTGQNTVIQLAEEANCNCAAEEFGRVMCTTHSELTTRYSRVEFMGNTANIGGALSINGTTLELSNSVFRNNKAFKGGALCASEHSFVHFIETHSILKNNSMFACGGATNLTDSQLTLDTSTEFISNWAHEGGAIYVQYTILMLENSSFIGNSAVEGGAIYALKRSEVHFRGSVTSLVNNTASSNGGAMYFSSSKLHFWNGIINFTGNSAELGGALFVEENSEYCLHKNKCFFEYMLNFPTKTKPFYFCNNRATEGSVYGGQLYGCGDFFEEFIDANSPCSSTESNTQLLASTTAFLCYCYNGHVRSCLSKRDDSVSIARGKELELSLASLDEREHFKPSTIIPYSSQTGFNLKLGEGEGSIVLNNSCEKVILHPYSKRETETLVLDTNSPCRYKSKLLLKIDFKPCPRGFQLVSSGECCECDIRLKSYSVVSCHIDNQTVETRGNMWLEYIEQKIVVSKTCPDFYCANKVTFIPTNGTKVNQCSSNRRGLLCGSCREHFSVSLGSVKCVHCTGSRKLNFLWLLLLFGLLGVLLVLFIVALNVTVAVGTINGLIFYTNIISASGLLNHHIRPFFSAFIAWINLDFGVETCFYLGMDVYQKTWLQFVFPLYIWILISLIIVASRYSTRIMKLFGRNIISALATLFLLSYAKMLKNIIVAFNFIDIYTGDADNHTDVLVPHKVWMYDGHVSYLTGKHLPLFIVALLFLFLLFMPYTLSLTFGQCLRSLPRRKGLKWTQSTIFTSFLDAYHAPFNKEYRYWTGLMLLARCLVFIILALSDFIILSVSDNNNTVAVNMFTISFSAAGLLTLKASMRKAVYKSLFINNLENLFLINLGLLAVMAYFFKGRDEALENILETSILLSLFLFAMIVAYHIFKKLQGIKHTRMFLQKSVEAIKCSRVMKLFVHKEGPINCEEDKPTFNTTTATSTLVELREALLDSM